jgi:hypothetical protein
MPRQRTFRNNAERQAAYRERKRNAGWPSRSEAVTFRFMPVQRCRACGAVTMEYEGQVQQRPCWRCEGEEIEWQLPKGE